MLSKKNVLAIMILVLAFSFTAPAANAKGNEYKQIVRHLKTKYKAKKVKIPFMFLARFAVSIVRPAGVKSFSVTIFEDLKFSKETLDQEMQAAMRDSFGADWSPILRVRSRDGEQVYMYMRDAGKDSVKISLVTIDKQQAAVIRATINPDKLAEFMDNPKIFGISLDDGEKTAEEKESDQKVLDLVNPKKEPEKTEEPKKDN
ncbi:MAG TPA: hypothetical protein VNB22_22280 [Pyrinomonadaceae bacterium]|nr:hypothetical protein [Pyrinomonadaceae bacterium]